MFRMERTKLLNEYKYIQLSEQCSERLHRINQLNRAAADYLCSVSQVDKYGSRFMSDLLMLSARYRSGFSGERGGSLMKKLETISLNLFLYPWRTEELMWIDKWSPFFKYELMDCFEGASDLIKMIGYREMSDGFRLCPDLLSSSSAALRTGFDCYLAGIECEILDDISVILKKDMPSVSWSQILEARHRTVGDVEVCAQAVRERSSGISSGVRWSLDGGRERKDLDDAEKRELRHLLVDFDAAGDFEERFGTAAKADSNNYLPVVPCSEQNGSVVKEPFRPFSDSNFMSFQRFTDQALVAYDSGGADSKDFLGRKRVDKVPSWVQPSSKATENLFIAPKECPKCKMLIQGNTLLCSYCNFYFT